AMNKLFKYISVLTLAAVFAGAANDVSGERMREHVKYLSSDKLEGRGVGTRGEKLATEYIAEQFRAAGAKPAGDNGTYFQRVPMIGAATEPSASLSAALSTGPRNHPVSFRWLDDFVGVTELQQTAVQFDAEAIFVGHGIVAPEFQWDDFKGVDVKDRVLVLFTNEPPSNDPKFFGGPALTYYGRWTYKYEEAARHGAKAVFIIHTTPTAGYGFEVVRSSWSGEDPQLKLPAGKSALAFAGWFTKDAAEKVLAMSGHNVDELLEKANSRDFHPIPLGIHIRGNMPTKIRQIESRNVVAKVEGSDDKLRSEAVVFTAHWDHLGIGPAVNGDSIYNGAVDNATGCAMLIEMARTWAALPQKPKRSAIFVAVTAEEAGLRGSEYYAAHPAIPLGKTALDINFDAFPPFGPTKDLEVTGADRTTVWPIVRDTAQEMHITLAPEAHPEQGEYYRSDHFSLAHAGVPSFSIEQGTDYPGKPADYGKKLFEDYNDKRYHQPSDEYQDDWNFGGMEQVAHFAMQIATAVANQNGLPTWRAGDEFLPAREKSFGRK
ncbi:MAG TPA: M28 family peptidase, partial [Bryobacteraceae bacterium]|nr:M28 family peptidase [Bryobacteraceae bacterium]